MARIATIPPEDFHERLSARLGHPTSQNRVALGSMVGWARRPEVALAFLELQDALRRSTSLRPRLLELVRLRVAFHNQCRSCMAVRSSAAVEDGLDDVAVCSLQRPHEAPDLSEAERAALTYADALATDHFSIDDGVFATLRQHFSEDEIVELGAHVGVCVGFGRVAMSWDLVDDLPVELRAEGVVDPWSVTPAER
ncbi:carboxymuconolactone decarboxylase family protein [Citricoccus nitrophenolicus]